MHWSMFVCLATMASAQVNINFEIVTKSEEALGEAVLSESIAKYNLSQPQSIAVDVVILNATIIVGSCAAGYYWEVDKCLPCECPLHEISTVLAVWFEPMT